MNVCYCNVLGLLPKTIIRHRLKHSKQYYNDLEYWRKKQKKFSLYQHTFKKMSAAIFFKRFLLAFHQVFFSWGNSVSSLQNEISTHWMWSTQMHLFKLFFRVKTTIFRIVFSSPPFRCLFCVCISHIAKSLSSSSQSTLIVQRTKWYMKSILH